MAQGDAKIRVGIDTGPALRGLRDLGREGKATSGRINERLNRGGAVEGFKVGAAAAFGFGLVKKTASAFGGIGDIVSESTSGLRADFDSLVGGPKARAQKQAREQSRESFAFSVGLSGDTSDAKAFRNNILPNIQRREEGRTRIDQALGGGRGLDDKDRSDVDKLITTIVEAIRDGFGSIISVIGTVVGK